MSRSALQVVRSEDGWETPPLGPEEGSAFGYGDRVFWGWNEDGSVFDYGDFEAREIDKMLKSRDYKARQIESVLSLPIMSAERDIVPVKGDKGELDWLSGFWEADTTDGGCEQTLDEVIGQMTTAIAYAKNFNELVFRPDGYDGKVGYRKVAYRPATTCRIKRDAQNGNFLGFEQEAYAPGPLVTRGMYPVQIDPRRAFVYVHGQRLDPLHGTSDLQIAHWCWKTKQKILFLWFQFLENVALPRTVVKANEEVTAKQIAAQIARLRGSGVIPIGTGGNPTQVTVDTLDSSGKGAEQYKEAITWLDQAASGSVLAGFLDLTGQAASGTGSYALSKDASNYFLQFEEAKTHEIERSVRRDLFAPLIRYNFGAKGKVPKLKFEPLNAEDKSDQITMLGQFGLVPPGGAIPTEFIAMLAQQVGTYFGMDGTKVHDLFVKAGKDAAAAAAAQSAAGASANGQAVAGMAGATGAANAMLTGAAPITPLPLSQRKPMPAALANLPWDKLGSAA